MTPKPETEAPLAVWAEALYLTNLLLLPGLAFLALLFLWLRHRKRATVVERMHLYQTLMVSLWGGVAIVTVIAVLLALGGLDSPWTWLWVLLYFTFVHSTLILLGIVGLVKAMAGQPWRYPLIGRRAERLAGLDAPS